MHDQHRCAAHGRRGVRARAIVSHTDKPSGEPEYKRVVRLQERPGVVALPSIGGIVTIQLVAAYGSNETAFSRPSNAARSAVSVPGLSNITNT